MRAYKTKQKAFEKRKGLWSTLTLKMKQRIEFRAYQDGGPNDHTRKIWKTIYPRSRDEAEVDWTYKNGT